MKKLILILILLSIPIFSQNKLLYTNAGKALISDTADVVRAEFKAVDDSLGNLISLILTDLEGDTLSYTVNEIDSLLALAATALQDVAITFPDQNTISFGGNTVIQLDPATLVINGSGQLTVIGGGGGGSGGLFVIDGNGDLMPNDAEVTDTYYELDGNGDIQPL